MMSDEERYRYLNEHHGKNFQNKISREISTMVGFGKYHRDGFKVFLAKDDGQTIITSPEGLRADYELAG